MVLRDEDDGGVHHDVPPQVRLRRWSGRGPLGGRTTTQVGLLEGWGVRLVECADVGCGWDHLVDPVENLVGEQASGAGERQDGAMRSDVRWFRLRGSVMVDGVEVVVDRRRESG